MMPGFWVKVTIAVIIAILPVYGVVKLKQKWPGCLTGSIMVVTFLVLPILWLIIYSNIPFYYLEPYRGRVLASGTGEPIVEAAVMVVYNDELHGFETFYRYVGTKETITDENGEYYIRSEWRFGRSGTPFGRFQIFKPGYSVESKSYKGFVDTFDRPNHDHRYWNTGYQIFELDQLNTKKERIDNLHNIDTHGADHDKIEYMLTLIEQERTLLEDSKVSNLRFVSSNPDQGTGMVRDIVHGQELHIALGDVIGYDQEWRIGSEDVIGFDQAEVTAIKENEIHLDIGIKLIRLKRLPGENTITIIQRNSNN